MEIKRILQTLQKKLKSTKYYKVTLDAPAVEENLRYFAIALNSTNYENTIPNKENSIEKNLSLLPRKIQTTRTIIVYEDGEELKEIITNITITYKKRKNENIETHLGETEVLFVEIDQKMTLANEEDIEIYRASMSNNIRQYLENLTEQAKKDYNEIMAELEEKLKKKRKTLRR